MVLKNSKPIFFLTSIWLIILLAIALWWSYLFLNYSATAIDFNDRSFTNMIKWEGAVFILLLISTSSLLFYYINKDQQKLKSMQSFFSTLTHELKTPLASIRLQSEVIKSISTESNTTAYVDRLIEDVTKLENHLDKTLQLSRVERGGNLNLVKVDLEQFIKNVIKESHFNITISYQSGHKYILADEFALKIIFRNLIENTKEHTKKTEALITIVDVSNDLKITYRDNGLYEGNYEKLGVLFYKHQSSKGSGIGLYLIKKLTKSMNGSFLITKDNQSKLNFEIKLKGHHEV